MFDEYLVCITGDKWDTLIKIDLKELIVIEEITLGKAIHLPGNPIQVNNETIVFSEFIHENNRTVKTNILSYNIKQNTLSSLKTVKGTLLMIGFVEANAIVAVHEKQLVKYEI